MPFENDMKVYGTGIRTWQFLEPLLANGHRVCACCYAIPSAYREGFESVYHKDFLIEGGQKYAAFDYNILKKEDFENIEKISHIFAEFEPDCILGCSFYPSYTASRLINHLEQNHIGQISGMKSKNSSQNPGDVLQESIQSNLQPLPAQFQAVKKGMPFWADLFGHVMAEAQARAFMDDDDGCLFHYWNSEYNIISTADVFSTVSARQKYALVGELGAIGRLNRHTSGYEFAHVVQCGMPLEDYRHEKTVLEKQPGPAVGDWDGDFIVLWTGGYNTWTDVDTLFKGLEIAMEKNPSIKFVSTGGEIPEQDLKTYPRFLAMIEKSRFSQNFIMKGWIRGEDVPNYYFEADVGINIDKDIYEVRLGSKNRILDWMRAGLAILSSNVCELTEIIEREKIGYTFKPNDPNDLADKILYLAQNKKELRQTAEKGKKYGMSHFNFNITTKDFLGWLDNPVFAPDKDRERKMFFDREEALKNLDIITSGQRKMIKQKDMRIKELESIVKKSFVYKLYGYLKIIKRKLSFKKQN